MVHPIQVADVQPTILPEVNAGDSRIVFIVVEAMLWPVAEERFQQGVNESPMGHQGDALFFAAITIGQYA
jgi:hypothetical protein